MTVTIPTWALLWLPVGYLVMGVLLVLPLLAWYNSRFFGKFSRRPWYDGWNHWQLWVGLPFTWPYAIWDIWATPRHNKKVLDKWKAERDALGD